MIFAVAEAAYVAALSKAVVLLRQLGLIDRSWPFADINVQVEGVLLSGAEQSLVPRVRMSAVDPKLPLLPRGSL